MENFYITIYNGHAPIKFDKISGTLENALKYVSETYVDSKSEYACVPFHLQMKNGKIYQLIFEISDTHTKREWAEMYLNIKTTCDCIIIQSETARTANEIDNTHEGNKIYAGN